MKSQTIAFVSLYVAYKVAKFVVHRFSTQYYEREAANVIDTFDRIDEDLEEELTPEIFQSIEMPPVPVTEPGVVDELRAEFNKVFENSPAAPSPVGNPGRLTKRRRVKPPRHKLACMLAKEAYCKFIHDRKTRNDANEIITLKWMSMRLAEFSDLRNADKAAIIDMALPLSYLPTHSKRYMSAVQRTTTWWSRSVSSSVFSWFDFYMGRATGSSWVDSIVGRPAVA